ncbi:MAG: hypothetical protein WBQ76_09420, partial [Candidatus Korobacteraceae bacterium]
MIRGITLLSQDNATIISKKIPGRSVGHPNQNRQDKENCPGKPEHRLCYVGTALALHESGHIAIEFSSSTV